MERDHGSREGKFPTDKPKIRPGDLYEGIAYFYYSVGAAEFRNHLIRPVSEETLEALEAYKPPVPSLVGASAEEFMRQRQKRKQERKLSAKRLVALIDDPDAYKKFLEELASDPEAPEYSAISFLKQFNEADRLYQLKRILPIHAFKQQ